MYESLYWYCDMFTQCLVASIHAKLEGPEAQKEGEKTESLPACGALDLDSNLLVIKEEAKGVKRQQGDEETGETLVSVQAFLRRIRSSLDRGVPLTMRPTLLTLCFAGFCSTSSGNRRSSVASTCSSCCSKEGETTECSCCCGCCWGCGSCRPHRQSVQGLCELTDNKGCGAAGCGKSECGKEGKTCKEGGCKRCCFMFYADLNGDAFVPLNSNTFGDFVRENYPEFGL